MKLCIIMYYKVMLYNFSLIMNNYKSIMKFENTTIVIEFRLGR